MKTRDLVTMGIPAGRCAEAAKQILQRAKTDKRGMLTVVEDLRRVAGSPSAFLNDPAYGALAKMLVDDAAAGGRFVPRKTGAPYQIGATSSSRVRSIR